jgi:NADH-ubiquinone oxidoreductase chain 2
MLLLSILSILLSNAVSLRRDIAILFNRIGVLSILYSINMAIASFIYTKQNIGLHGGLLHITSITQIFQIVILVITVLILLLTSFSYFSSEINIIPEWSKKSINNITFNINNPDIKESIQKFFNHTKENIIEYPLIILFIISGGIFLISTNDLITIFLSIELQSYGLYLLSTIYRNSELSTSGGLIYFLLGGFSSSLILLGISFIYINSGTTNLDNIYVITSISNIWDNSSWYKSNYINISLFIFSIGFLFKISAAPFHFWSPDVYDSIPTIVTIFVAIMAKISIFIFLLGLVYYTNIYFNYNNNWYYILLSSSIFSLIIGTILGITQFRIKKLLAYSAISHVGFLLLALNISSVESIQAFIFI